MRVSTPRNRSVRIGSIRPIRCRVSALLRPARPDLPVHILRRREGSAQWIPPMPQTISTPLTDTLRDAAHLLTGAATDYDALLALVGNVQLALIGEASHGTHEFYHERIEITKRLIIERHFTSIAVEADWPDAYRVNRYVRWEGNDHDADSAL